MPGKLSQTLQRRGGVALLAAGSIAISACGAVNQGVSSTPAPTPAPSDLIYVFNQGDASISVIDSASNQVKVTKTVPFPAYGLYPSNQYGLKSGYLLLPQPTKVTILKDADLSVAATIPMVAAQGLWSAILPDGKTGVVVARETDTLAWVDMDPSSKAFGSIQKSLTTPGKVGFCDVSLSKDGHYAYIPDLFTSQLQVVDLTTGQTASIDASPVKKPFMGTVSWDGKIWAVEGKEGPGQEAYLSLADPTHPKLLKVLGAADGLGSGPHTDEFRPDNRYDFVIDQTSDKVSVVDTTTFAIVQTIVLPTGSLPRVGAFSYNGNKLFVNLEGTDSVAVIDTHAFKLTATIPVGKKPSGLAPTRYGWTG